MLGALVSDGFSPQETKKNWETMTMGTHVLCDGNRLGTHAMEMEEGPVKSSRTFYGYDSENINSYGSLRERLWSRQNNVGNKTK